MKKFRSLILVFVVGLLTVGVVTSLPLYATVPGTNSLVNYDNTGTSPSSGGNQVSRISEDGNIVAWTSSTHNIIPSDPFSASTTTVIYKRNLQTGVASYASPINTAGTLAGVTDKSFAMSRNGRYFVFFSRDKNIVSSPTIPAGTDNHVYLTDTQAGTTVLVDKSSAGVLANADSDSTYGINVSDDGRFVVFMSQATNLLSSGNPSTISTNYYLKDMKTGQVINPVLSSGGSRANGSVAKLISSCDGSLFTFSSNSTNLTAQDNGKWNTYVLDLRNGYVITNLTYSANQDSFASSISCSGRYIVLASAATNLTTDTVSGSVDHYFRYDRMTDSYSLIDKSTSGYISSTVYASTGTLGNSMIVGDNGKVVFISSDHAMVSPAAVRNKEVYLRDPELGTTELVPINSSSVEQNVVGNDSTLEINARGDKVLYNSSATNLVPGMTSGALKLVLSKLQ